MGAKVGWKVGWADGVNVGRGVAIGEPVGCPVRKNGELVSLNVGARVGLTDAAGRRVGFEVGDFVRIVGALD